MTTEIKLNGRVTLEELQALPVPQALSLRHRPVAHATVVELATAELAARGLPVSKMAWELSRDGARLDGRLEVLDEAREAAQREALVESRKATYTGIDGDAVQALLPDHLKGGHGAVVTVSHANDRTRSLRLNAAMAVFVCNNLAVGSAGGVNIIRRHTGDQPWEDRLVAMLDQALSGFAGFNQQVEAMRAARLTTSQAKELIYDAFTLQYAPLPPSDFLAVHETYFGHGTEDVGGETRWDLHNAFTRCMRELSERRQIERGSLLTELFTRDLLAVEPRPQEVNPN